jgi:hypothetical protein
VDAQARGAFLTVDVNLGGHLCSVLRRRGGAGLNNSPQDKG